MTPDRIAAHIETLLPLMLAFEKQGCDDCRLLRHLLNATMRCQLWNKAADALEQVYAHMNPHPEITNDQCNPT